MLGDFAKPRVGFLAKRQSGKMVATMECILLLLVSTHHGVVELWTFVKFAQQIRLEDRLQRTNAV